jgi:hypothetical protein
MVAILLALFLAFPSVAQTSGRQERLQLAQEHVELLNMLDQVLIVNQQLLSTPLCGPWSAEDEIQMHQDLEKLKAFLSQTWSVTHRCPDSELYGTRNVSRQKISIDSPEGNRAWEAHPYKSIFYPPKSNMIMLPIQLENFFQTCSNTPEALAQCQTTGHLECRKQKRLRDCQIVIYPFKQDEISFEGSGPHKTIVYELNRPSLWEKIQGGPDAKRSFSSASYSIFTWGSHGIFNHDYCQSELLELKND